MRQAAQPKYFSSSREASAGCRCSVLSSNLVSRLGFTAAVAVFLSGGAICAILASVSVYSGARTRMSLALLAEATFGTKGAHFVQLAIALALLASFALIVSILGAAVSTTTWQVSGAHVPTPAISIPLCVLIALIAHRGIGWLEKLGAVIVPLTFVLVSIAVWKTLPYFSLNGAGSLSNSISMGSGVSAIIGTYIIGTIIQPDFGRFVKRPELAPVAAFSALALVYPAILTLSSIPSIALHKSDLIAALIGLGIGIPALVLLLLGAWIEASACLYSGSLALAKLFPRVPFARIVVAGTILCSGLAFTHPERHFVTFFLVLGVALPPVAAVQCVTALWPSRWVRNVGQKVSPGAVDVPAFIAWFVGTVLGTIAQGEVWSLTAIPAVDSIIAAALVTIIIRVSRSRNRIRSVTVESAE